MTKINETKDKIKKYLLETNINNKKQNVADNLNVLGVILAFTTKIKYNEAFKTHFLLSTLLFLDLRTGRIERYLINSSDPKANEKGIDYKDDLFFTWNNIKHRVFHDFEHSPLGKVTSISELGDGRINSKFYCIFMAELLRDYLKYFLSFNDGNIASLRKLTAPIISGEDKKFTCSASGLKKDSVDSVKPTLSPLRAENDDINKSNNTATLSSSPEVTEKKYNIKIKSSLGTGVLNNIEKQLINQSYDYKLKDFIAFKSHRFFTNQFNQGSKGVKTSINSKLNKGVIFAPKQFKNKMIDLWFDTLDIKLVYTGRGELSQICKDLTRTLSVKTIDKGQDVTMRIKTFNYNIVKKLTELENMNTLKMKNTKEAIIRHRSIQKNRKKFIIED